MNLISQKIYLVLLSVSVGIRAPSLIAENTGYCYENILKTLKELQEMGLVKDVESHRYVITPLGNTVCNMMFELDCITEYRD